MSRHPQRAAAVTPTPWTPPILTRRNSRAYQIWRRSDQPPGKRLEVLHDSCEVELVTSAGEASKPQPLEAMMGLQMAEAHLDFLALVSRFEEGLGLHLAPRHVAGIFMEIARKLSRLVPGAALGSEWAEVAVAL